MAATKRIKALTFQVGPVATIKASCERFIRDGSNSAGIFKTRAELKVMKPVKTTDKLIANLTVGVVGVPKDAPESRAFETTCTVEVEMKFDEPLVGAPTNAVIDHVGLMLYQVAAERCRAMTLTMGYPAHRMLVNPPTFSDKRTVEGDLELVAKPAKKKVGSAPAKKRAARKTTN